MDKESFSRSVGIMGGGQLARMLALSGAQMGLSISALCERESDPAAQVTEKKHIGSPSDLEALSAFVEPQELVTFESEFIDTEVLARVSQKHGVPVLPDPSTVGLVQDRLTQKRLLEQCNLPHTPYLEVGSLEDVKELKRRFSSPVILKKRRFGYDGYGTFIIREPKDVENLPAGDYIAEPWVSFRREVAVQIVRNSAGQTEVLPWVETRQENSRCLWVKGPIGGDNALARRLAKFMQAINYVGVMAFEFFETKEGKLLINELAPRVHNSGHYSLDALSVDQFSYHLLAILGRPLPKPRLRAKGFAMINLLGTSQEPPRILRWPKEGQVHWYGKRENRPGRKMGHINTLADSPNAALKLAFSARKGFLI